ncbi:MAG: hypothetical protein Q4B59_01385 [Lachnospiraceae bacterium]|nr:hypothetical protein [Lachnospiraceae bacterium]
MLRKLLKYEVKAMGRVMLPLYLAMLLIAAVVGITSRMRVNSALLSVLNKITVISAVVLVICVVTCGIAIVVLSIQRYYKNLLGTEGHLMFTLPATTFSLIASKAISTMLWIVAGGVVGVLAGFEIIAIHGDLAGFLEAFGADLQSLLDMMNLHDTMGYVAIALSLIVGVLGSLCKVYAAISIGHQANNHRVAFSVAAYIGIGIAEMTLSWLTMKVGVLQNVVNAMHNSLGSTGVYWGSLGLAVIQALFYGFISWILIDRRLNLE